MITRSPHSRPATRRTQKHKIRKTPRESAAGGLIAWSQRCRIPEFTALAKTLKRFRPLICNTLDDQVSNLRAEGINTQLAALTARARGFHSAEAFIAMAELTCGGLCPDLPGR